MLFNKDTFRSQCGITQRYDVSSLVQGVVEEPPEPIDGTRKDTIKLMIQSVRPFQENIVMLNGSFFFWVVKKGKLTICERSLCDINKAIEAKDLKEQSLEEVIAVQYHNILPIGWYGVDRYASHMSTGDGSSCMAA